MRLYSIGQISNSEKSNILDKHREMYNGYRQVNQPVSNEQPLYVQDFANDKNGITVNNRGEVKKYTNMGINEQWQAFAADAIATELGGAELAPFIAPTISQKLSDLGEETNEDEMCSECGGMMEEGECMECGKGYMEEEDDNDNESSFADKAIDFAGKAVTFAAENPELIATFMAEDTDEGIYDVAEPFNKSKNKFDYTDEQEMYEDVDYEPMTSAFDDELDEQINAVSPGYSKIKPAYDFDSSGPLQPKGAYNEEELDELGTDELERGKKYNYKSPSFDDEIEFDDEHDHMGGEKMYNFKGNKMGHTMGAKHIEDFVSHLDDTDELSDEGDMDTAFSRMRRGKADIEDTDWEEVDEDIVESFIIQKNKINEMMNRMNGYN